MALFPAGLMDNQIEIFGSEFRASCLMDGKTVVFAEFPESLRNSLQEKLDMNSRAKNALIEWGLADHEQLERFTFCMYAGFDHHPDFNYSNELSSPEYHNHCGLRGICGFEGRCCGGLILANGKLSPREVEVLIMIGRCYSDKLMCFELEISIETLRNHKNSIERKAGIKGKVAMGILAHKYRLL